MNTHQEHGKRSHAINHAARALVARRVSKRAKRTAARVAKRLRTFESRASAALTGGQSRLMSAARGVSDWVAENPRVAIGALIGTGLLVGMLGATRFGRATLLGLGGIAAAMTRRFA